MVKAFYKIKMPRKVFYDPNMAVRSSAYGSEVWNDFLAWESYYQKKKKVFGEKHRLWRGDDLFGSEYDPEKAGRRNMQAERTPPLWVDGTEYRLEEDGYVSVGGKRGGFALKMDVKAWSISQIQTDAGEERTLFVIGKPYGGDAISLLGFRMRKADIDETPILTVPLAPSMDSSSKLLCMGKHIFMIHNAKLDYYYYDAEQGEIDRVAIGEDGDNSSFAWCDLASSLVANGKGFVYWIAGADVVGFPIGYPRRLVRSEGVARETVVHIRCDAGAVYVYRRDKNTGSVRCYRMVCGEDGSLREAAMPQGGAQGRAWR